jgi:hypothetical protein
MLSADQVPVKNAHHPRVTAPKTSPWRPLGSQHFVTDLPPPTFAFVLRGAMREHVLLFCLLGLVLTATIILVIAPGAVTWTLAFIE